MTRDEFISYLRNTLIPDLCESGRFCTAADFLVACEFMENPHTSFIQTDGMSEFVERKYRDLNSTQHIVAK